MDTQAEFERSVAGGVPLAISLIVIKFVGLWFTMLGPTLKGAFLG